jgi:hypothetical protein
MLHQVQGIKTGYVRFPLEDLLRGSRLTRGPAGNKDKQQCGKQGKVPGNDLVHAGWVMHPK